MKVSQLELLFTSQLDQAHFTGYVREHRFAPPRLWRFDFAWLSRAVAVEIEGGVFSGGRHVRGTGFEQDAEKYAHAVLLGWKVLRVPGSWVESGEALTWITALLEEKAA